MTNIYRFMSSETCIAVSSSSISLRLKLKNSTVGPYFLPWPSANVSYSRVCTDFWIHNSRLFPYFFPKTIISFSRLQVIGDLTYHSSLAGTKHTRKHHAFFLVLKSKTKLAYFPSCSGYFVYFFLKKLTWYPSALWMYQQADLSVYSFPLDSCPCAPLFLPEQKRTTSSKVYITLGVEPERIQWYNVMQRLRVTHKAAPSPAEEGRGGCT